MKLTIRIGIKNVISNIKLERFNTVFTSIVKAVISVKIEMDK